MCLKETQLVRTFLGDRITNGRGLISDFLKWIFSRVLSADSYQYQTLRWTTHNLCGGQNKFGNYHTKLLHRDTLGQLHASRVNIRTEPPDRGAIGQHGAHRLYDGGVIDFKFAEDILTRLATGIRLLTVWSTNRFRGMFDLAFEANSILSRETRENSIRNTDAQPPRCVCVCGWWDADWESCIFCPQHIPRHNTSSNIHSGTEYPSSANSSPNTIRETRRFSRPLILRCPGIWLVCVFFVVFVVVIGWLGRFNANTEWIRSLLCLCSGRHIQRCYV